MFHVRHFSSFSDGVMVNAEGRTMTVRATRCVAKQTPDTAPPFGNAPTSGQDPFIESVSAQRGLDG
jgi:hypothetical protein